MQVSKNKVYYLGFYGDDKAYVEKRVLVPSSVNKMDYIARALEAAQYNVEIISPTWIGFDRAGGFKWSRSRKVKVSNNILLVLPLSFSFPFRFAFLLAKLFSKIWLLIYFVYNVKKGENVIVYNSPYYFSTIYWLKRILGFKLILEVEELYNVVFSIDEHWKKKEMRLIKTADSYIFPNDLMYNLLNVKPKKQKVIYGSYHLSSNYESMNFDDGKIHVVYAGIIDKLKNGAFNAICAAEYLSEDYEIHILGFGQPADIEDLQHQIKLINDYSQCKVIYEGKKTGIDYIKFITACQIGLSTQKNEGEYLSYTFPSKVLSYLSMGLRVVAAKMDCLTMSSLNSFIEYYETDSGSSIAKSIKRIVDFDRNKPLAKIKELNSEFIRDIQVIIND